MVHHRNDRFGLVDCSNRGCYHNRIYRDAAVLAGLVCREPRDSTYGYGITSLGKRAKEAIERLHPKESLFGEATR
jgi:hypothetical protein